MKRKMPNARSDRPLSKHLQWDIAPKALESWSPTIVGAGPAAAVDNTISIYDPIGFDPWTGDGVTANRIAAALRTIGDSKDVTVNINSPGGDMFEGLAIYNLLRQHKGTVTVKVLGLAASAASIIAMAGDQVQIARAGFLMIHDCWIMAMGNRNDMRDVADMLEPFDRAMADIYAARTGEKTDAMLALMDAETWIGGNAAIEQGFADELLPADQVGEQARSSERIAAFLLDLALAKAGLPRSERRAMLSEYKAGGKPSAATEGGTPCAAPTPALPTRDAGRDVLDALRAFSLEVDLRTAAAAATGVVS